MVQDAPVVTVAVIAVARHASAVVAVIAAGVPVATVAVIVAVPGLVVVTAAHDATQSSPRPRLPWRRLPHRHLPRMRGTSFPEPVSAHDAEY